MQVVSLNFGQCGLQLANLYWSTISSHDDLGTVDGSVRDEVFYMRLKQNKMPRCLVIDTETGPAMQLLSDSKMNLMCKDNVMTLGGKTGDSCASVYKQVCGKYAREIEDKIAKLVEDCDHIEYFNSTFATSGASGSGIGAYTTELLDDFYHKVHKVANIVHDRNVSPVSHYNDVLCLSMLEYHATMIIPFSNTNITHSIRDYKRGSAKTGTLNYFDSVNEIICDFEQRFNIITTCHKRGKNRISTIRNTLLPFENLRYASPFKSPVKRTRPEKLHIEDVFGDLFSPKTRISPIPKSSKMSTITSSVFTRLNINTTIMSSIMRNQGTFQWNPGDEKVNIGNDHKAGEDVSLIALANHTGISQYLDQVCEEAQAILKRGAFLHHFDGILSIDDMYASMFKLIDTSKDYKVQDSIVKQL